MPETTIIKFPRAGRRPRRASPNPPELEQLLIHLYITLDATIAAVDADEAFCRALDWNLLQAVSYLESSLVPFPAMLRRMKP